jgi:hypothetical protein
MICFPFRFHFPKIAVEISGFSRADITPGYNRIQPLVILIRVC